MVGKQRKFAQVTRGTIRQLRQQELHDNEARHQPMEQLGGRGVLRCGNGLLLLELLQLYFDVDRHFVTDSRHVAVKAKVRPEHLGLC